jgi:hypothetical protein
MPIPPATTAAHTTHQNAWTIPKSVNGLGGQEPRVPGKARHAQTTMRRRYKPQLADQRERLQRLRLQRDRVGSTSPVSGSTTSQSQT